ncbi:unnamed protein product, partial [Choristocarpus tenellus]
MIEEGGILWAAIMTRPDVSFAVRELALCVENPSLTDWLNTRRVIGYILGTREHGITFGDFGIYGNGPRDQ